MDDKQIENYFTAVKQRFDEQDEKLGRIEDTVKTVLEIVRNYDEERKEIKSSLWELDKRISKLEHSKA